MSIIGSNILAGAAGSSVSAYEIEQSLRFRGAQYLDRSYSSATPSTWTLSFWVKPGKIGGTQALLGRNNNNITYNYFGYSAETLYTQRSGAQQKGTIYYRDYSAWYHIVARTNDNGATAQIYVNGVQDTTVTTLPSAYSGTFSFGAAKGVGTSAKVIHFTGYMAEIHYAASYLDLSTFGEFNADGVWVPIDVTGVTYGTDGFYLDFSDPSNIGADRSGNGNNFTASGFDTTNSTASTYDVMSDTPTTNWCTLNPLLNQGGSFSEGNLVFTGVGTSYQGSKGTIAIPLSGKWYWETTATTHTTTVGNWTAVGMATAAVPLTSFAGEVTGSVYYGDRNDANTGIFNDTSTVDKGQTLNFSQGDILQCAYDADTGKFWFGVNNSWWDSSSGTTGNPSAGTNETLTAVSREYFPLVQTNRTHVMTINFGQRDFAYTPPTNFLPLNTANLPAPDIADGSDYFNTLTYTGNGTGSFTGVGFQPDFTWIKCRNAAESHDLFDAVRGAPAYLQSNTTAAEQSYAGYALTSFDSDGFTLNDPGGGGYHVNKTGNTYVSWNWLASNTSGSSNTDGSITSTVSANPTAGFSIVTYTGTNNNATVGHGLGVAPSFIITKNRNTSNHSWYSYHKDLGASYYIYLNLSNAASTGAAVWNGAPSSTVFTLGTFNGANQSTFTYVAYCFAEVEGYSKFGSYTGNGSTNGPFVYCGFKPAWIMIKNSTTAQGWYISDNKRDTYNQVNNALFASSSSAESSSTGGASYDFLSNGFKPRTSNNDSNGSGDTYIFAAFAEHPTGGSGVSPATAR